MPSDCRPCWVPQLVFRLGNEHENQAEPISGPDLTSNRRKSGRFADVAQIGRRSPEDVDVVVCSHLHIDHIGWLVVADAPYFPNAVVRYGAADWQRFVVDADAGDRTRRIMEVLAEAGRLDPWTGTCCA